MSPRRPPKPPKTIHVVKQPETGRYAARVRAFTTLKGAKERKRDLKASGLEVDIHEYVRKDSLPQCRDERCHCSAHN
jgi:hypothetical protein